MIQRHHLPLKNWDLVLKKTVSSDQIQKISCLEPALDKEHLITGSSLGNLTFWKYADLLNISEYKDMKISHSPISSLIYLNDGKIAFCGCEDGNIYKIDITIFTAKSSTQLDFSIKALTYALINDKLNLIAASGTKIYEIDYIKEKVLGSINAHDNTITDLVYNQRKEILASCSEDKTIKLWNLENKQPLGILTGHVQGINSICFAFSQKNFYIVSCAKDSYITFWNLSDKNLNRIEKMSSIGEKVIYVNDKKSVICINKNGIFSLWNIEKENEKKEFSIQKSVYSAVTYFEDGRNLVLGNKNGVLEFWNTAAEEQTL